MKLYRAKRSIKHGAPDGKVSTYNPGDEVPEKLVLALPELVEVVNIAGVERAEVESPKPAADPDKPKPLSQLNLETLQERAAALGISIKADDGTAKSRSNLIGEIRTKEQSDKSEKSQAQNQEKSQE